LICGGEVLSTMIAALATSVPAVSQHYCRLIWNFPIGRR